MDKKLNLHHVITSVVPSAVDLLALMMSIVLQGILLGRYDSDALAAEGTLTQLGFFVFVIFLIFIMGGSILISRRIGEGKRHEANIAFTQSLLIATIISVLLGISAVIGFPFIASSLYGLSPKIVNLGMQLIYSLLPFLLIVILNFVGTGLIRGSGDTHISMTISLVSSITNVVLAYFFIYGKGGFPELGIRGMGLSVGIGHTLGFLLMLTLIALRKTKLDIYPRYIFRPNPRIIKNVFRLGFPVSAEQLTWTFGLLVIQGYVARLNNTDIYKFHQVIFQVLEMISVIYQGIGIAKMSMIGTAIGAHNHKGEWRIHRISTNTVLPIAILTGAFIFFNADRIMHTFLPDIENVTVGANVLKFFAFMQIPRALSVMTSAHLRARGDVLWMLLSTGILSAVFMIFITFIFGLTLGWGLMGIWIAISLNEVAKYVWHRIRLRQEKFKRV